MTMLYLVPEFHDRNEGSLGSRCVDEIGCFRHLGAPGEVGVFVGVQASYLFRKMRYLARDPKWVRARPASSNDSSWMGSGHE